MSELVQQILDGDVSFFEGETAAHATGWLRHPETYFGEWLDDISAKLPRRYERTLLLGNGETWTGRLVFTSWTASQSSLYDLFRAEMPGYGWQEVTSVRASISVQTWQREKRICTVQIRDSTVGSEVILTMAPIGNNGAGAASPAGSAYPPAPAAAPAPVVTKSNLR